MKHRIFIALSIPLLVGALLVGSRYALFASSGAVMANAGLPTLAIYGDYLAAGWQDWSWSVTNNFASSTPVHSGNLAMATTFNGAWAGLSLRAPAPISTTGYTAVTFWVHGGASGSRSLVAFTQQTDAGANSPMFSFSAPAGTWTPVTITLSALANPTAIARITIQDSTGAAQPTFYIDDLALAGSGSAAPADGSIRLNASGAPLAIDPRVRGSNLPAWLGASRFADPVFRARTAASGLTLLRMPGGSYSNSYGWLSCEMGANQANAQTCGRGWETWVSKPTDFLNFIKATGMAGMWVVNPNSTPQEAAAAVAFFNATVTNTLLIGVDSKGFDWKTAGYWAQLRSSHGNPNPIGIKLWAVGNEVYGGTPASGGTMCQTWGWENSWTCDGTEYVNGARGYFGYTAFRTAMRSVDASIQVGAVGNVPSADYNNFGNKVIAAAGSTMDYYDIHIYGYSGMPASFGAAMAQPVTTWPTIMTDVRSSFTANAGGRQAPIAVTEYNMFSGQDYDTGLWMTRAVNALYMADTMGQMIQSGVVIANQWDLANGKATNGTMYDLLQVDNAWYRGPQYYVAPLWARFGSQMLPISSTFDAAAQLSVYGGQVSAGSNVYSIIAINKSGVSMPATITIDSTSGPLGIISGTVDIVQASSLNEQAVTFNNVMTPSDSLSNALALPMNATSVLNGIRYTFAPNSITLLKLTTNSTVPTATPVSTATATPTAIATATKTPTAAATPTALATATKTPTAVTTATKAPTATPTKAPTATPTKAPTATPTKAPTATPTKAPTATPTKAPTATPIRTCTVHYVVTSSTATTFAASVTFVNLTGSTLNNWNLTWSFPGNQTISSISGVAFTQSKTVVTVKDTKNGSKLANGVSTTFTFNAKYSGVNAAPAGYTLSGFNCVIN